MTPGRPTPKPLEKRRRRLAVLALLCCLFLSALGLGALNGCSHAPIGWEVVPDEADRVPVFFVTDREASAPDQFGSKRAENLRFGVAWVALPSGRPSGGYPRPLPLAPIRADRHIALVSVELLTRDAFMDRLADSWSANPDVARMVFVPGYGLTFESAACRLAQMACDLDAEPPLLVSWPSHGSFTHYARDHRMAAESVSTLRDLLIDLSASRSAERFGAFGIIAHSTGAEILSQALANPDQPLAVPIEHAVFLAADVDAATLAQRIEQFAAVNQVTVYASKDDISLWLSRLLHGNDPRGGEMAGRLGPPTQVVDATDVRTQMWGHIYYRDSPEVLDDLRRVLTSR